MSSALKNQTAKDVPWNARATGVSCLKILAWSFDPVEFFKVDVTSFARFVFLATTREF